MIKTILSLAATCLLSSAALAQDATALPSQDLRLAPGQVQTQQIQLQSDQYYTYDFGSTWVHSPLQTEFRLTNTGNVDLRVYQIAITAGDFQSYHYCPAVLPPNTYCNIVVIFNPWSEGFKTGRLYTETTAGLMTIDLRGWAYR